MKNNLILNKHKYLILNLDEMKKIDEIVDFSKSVLRVFGTNRDIEELYLVSDRNSSTGENFFDFFNIIFYL